MYPKTTDQENKTKPKSRSPENKESGLHSNSSDSGNSSVPPLPNSMLLALINSPENRGAASGSSGDSLSSLDGSNQLMISRNKSAVHSTSTFGGGIKSPAGEESDIDSFLDDSETESSDENEGRSASLAGAQKPDGAELNERRTPKKNKMYDGFDINSEDPDLGNTQTDTNDGDYTEKQGGGLSALLPEAGITAYKENKRIHLECVNLNKDAYYRRECAPENTLSNADHAAMAVGVLTGSVSKRTSQTSGRCDSGTLPPFYASKSLEVNEWLGREHIAALNYEQDNIFNSFRRMLEEEEHRTGQLPQECTHERVIGDIKSGKSSFSVVTPFSCAEVSGLAEEADVSQQSSQQRFPARTQMAYIRNNYNKGQKCLNLVAYISKEGTLRGELIKNFGKDVLCIKTPANKSSATLAPASAAPSPASASAAPSSEEFWGASPQVSLSSSPSGKRLNLTRRKPRQAGQSLEPQRQKRGLQLRRRRRKQEPSPLMQLPRLEKLNHVYGSSHVDLENIKETTNKKGTTYEHIIKVLSELDDDQYKGALNSILGFFRKTSDAEVTPFNGDLTNEQRQVLDLLVHILLIEDYRVPTGGTLPIALIEDALKAEGREGISKVLNNALFVGSKVAINKRGKVFWSNEAMDEAGATNLSSDTASSLPSSASAAATTVNHHLEKPICKEVITPGTQYARSVVRNGRVLASAEGSSLKEQLKNQYLASSEYWLKPPQIDQLYKYYHKPKLPAPSPPSGTLPHLIPNELPDLPDDGSLLDSRLNSNPRKRSAPPTSSSPSGSTLTYTSPPIQPPHKDDSSFPNPSGRNFTPTSGEDNPFQHSKSTTDKAEIESAFKDSEREIPHSRR